MPICLNCPVAKKSTSTWTEAEIEDMASQLDLGVSIFVPKQGGEFEFLPREKDLLYAEEEVWGPALQPLKNAPDNYFQIDPPESFEQYRWMREFADTRPSSQDQDKLHDALSIKRPFAHFKEKVQVLGLIDAWHQFTKVKYVAHVRLSMQFPSPVSHPWVVGEDHFPVFNGEEE